MKAPASLRIVIADDEPLILHLVGQEVNIAGHKVVGQALDGREALELTERLKPDVVLMDISMPEMDGFEATELIQDRCPTPVVMLTAHLEQEILERAADCGVGAYLAKPPQAGDINRAIVVAMARHDDLMKILRMNREMQAALLELKVLHGLLPICCSCKKIHDESGKWEQLESYISAHTDAKFTHTYCPSCARQYFPGMVDENGLVREHRLPTAR
jgi:AmiR/NasT family two-component response regulator